MRQGQVDVKGRLGGIHELLKTGKYEEADREVSRHWLGRGQDCYQPLGDLHFQFDNLGETSGYRRSFDLQTGIARVVFESKHGRQEREYFASASDNAVVTRLCTEHAGSLHFTMRLRSPHPGETAVDVSRGETHFSGQLPGFCLRRSWDWIADRGDEWKYPEVYDEAGHLRAGAEPVLYGKDAKGRGLRFHFGLVVQLTGGGSIFSNGEELAISDGTDVVIILTAASSYSRFDALAGVAPQTLVRARLSSLRRCGYADLRAAHERQYRSLFDRVQISLSGGAPVSEDTREWRGNAACELRLTETVFQFGRYLLISSSYPDCMHPANLQGIWNEEITPPWASAYTTNINLQMNYWPAGPANLLECDKSLIRLIKECAENGRITAAQSYGLPGWVLHHNTDAWRKTDPVDFTARTAFWPMASGWLCCHLWEHYLFILDDAFLKITAYPLMKEACEFYFCWLVEDDEGYLVTPVSTSPENEFHTPEGQSASVSPGCTMDISILRELFLATENAARLCGDECFAARLVSFREKLLPLRIGRLGQLQEWACDWDRADDHHRHVSHLFGVFPGTQITSATPELQRAALRSLELRGDGGTGWSQMWKATLYARLGEPEKAWNCLRALLWPVENNHPLDDQKCDSMENRGGLYPNLFAACPPFQIDANFGFVAAVCEMLMQSHEDFVHLLPALPAAWSNGSVSGLRARGGLEVSLTWCDGVLDHAVIKAQHSGAHRFVYRDRSCELVFRSKEERVLQKEAFR